MTAIRFGFMCHCWTPAEVCVASTGLAWHYTSAACVHTRAFSGAAFELIMFSLSFPCSKKEYASSRHKKCLTKAIFSTNSHLLPPSDSNNQAGEKV
jgi:hypothetical protein